MSRHSGFTLVEAVLSLTFFAVVMSSFVAALRATQRASQTIRGQSKVQQQALDVLASVREELSRSGFTADAPWIYDGAEIGADFPEFAHAAPHVSGDAELESCDIAYLLPADADGDGWPDVENGAVLWEEDPRAFLLVPNERGSNDLVQRTPERTRTVARDVERMSFSTPDMKAFAIPLDCLAAEVELREGEGGSATRLRLGAVVRLANGGLSP